MKCSTYLVEEMAKAAERHGQKNRAKVPRHSGLSFIPEVADVARHRAQMLAFTHIVPSLPSADAARRRVPGIMLAPFTCAMATC